MTTVQRTNEIIDGIMFEVENYGEVMNCAIVNTFAYDMSFNDLREKNNNEEDYTNLIVKFNEYACRKEWSENTTVDTRHTMYFFDNKLVLEKRTSIHDSSNINICLGEIELYMEENADSEEEEEDEVEE